MAKVQEFINEQRKVNTTKSTVRDMKILTEWLLENKFEFRSIEDIPPLELRIYLQEGWL